MTTRQQLFDNALNGLRLQGMKSRLRWGDEFDAYRGREKCKCAIGFSIPDESYTKSLEQTNAHDPVIIGVILGLNPVTHNWKIAQYKQENGPFLNQMQRDLHDTMPARRNKKAFRALLEHRARVFAENFHLTYSKPAAA